MNFLKYRTSNLMSGYSKQIKGWSVNQQDWSEVEKLIRKLKWKQLRLMGNNTNEVSDQPGIYCLAVAPPVLMPDSFKKRNFYNVLYIGESGNLRKRFRNYLSKSTKDWEKIKDAQTVFHTINFVYAEIPGDPNDDRKKREYIETKLTQALGPPINKKHQTRSAVRDGTRGIKVANLFEDKN